MDEGSKKKRVVIVGGGAAGWMTAAYVCKKLDVKNNPSLEVTLVESPDIPTVGVGEATICQFNHFLDVLGIDKAHWMAACNATLKLGIRFVNWRGDEGGDVWTHPFWKELQNVNGSSLLQWWALETARKGSPAFPMKFTLNEQLMDCQKSSFFPGDRGFKNSETAFAYHFNTALHGEYMKKIALENGARHIVDTVDDIVVTDEGITHIMTRRNWEVFGDFFVDCTGFKAELMTRLGVGHRSYSGSLLCDSAVVIPLEHKDKEGEIAPYTLCTALSSGWAWEIPLTDRMGHGYVYSSLFENPEKAEDELRGFLGKRSEGKEALHISAKVGRLNAFRVKNCVAIGLSAGFVEPLESTGLHLAQIGIEKFVYYILDEEMGAQNPTQFDRVMNDQYESILNFIVLHYCLTQREDTPFWKANKYSLVIPAGVQEILQRWDDGVLLRKDILQEANLLRYSLFKKDNFLFCLAGMRRMPKHLPESLRHDNSDVVDFAKSYIQELFQKVNFYVGHREFIEHLNYEYNKR